MYRERIDTNDAVLALGNWLNRRPQKPQPITGGFWRKLFWRVDGYDLYKPADMDPVDLRYYNDVVRMARGNPYVRVMS